MKILIVNKFLYPRGGAETYIDRIGRELKSLGHSVQYFGMCDRRNTMGNELGLETGAMDFHSRSLSRFTYPLRILYSTEASRMLQMVAAAFEPDVIHLNNINFQLTPSVIHRAAKMGIPMVQTVHDFQMICPNHLMLEPRKKVLCDKCVEGSKWNCARNRCIHGSLAKSVLGSLEGELYRYLPEYDKISRFVCPSFFLEKQLLRDPRYAGKTMVLHNFTLKGEEALELEKQDYVLYFGRLAEEKGIHRLLEACRRLPDIPFVAAGSGPLEGLFDDCPPNVRFVGFRTGQELDRLISQARFSVYFPVWYENCPLSVLESLALGTPVLANRIGGIEELVRDGETGVLIDEFTPDHYAAQIDRLYRDKERLAKLTKNCQRQEGIMTLEAYCEKLLQLYEAVCRKGKRQ